jgi:long-subunit acyl-CoA synthetase (AMP-forming)
VVITERQFLERIKAARGTGSEPSHLVCVDGDADGAISLEELEQLADPEFDFDAAWRAVEPGDVLTLIYTSGTTGPPKGVELTHANMLAQCRAVGQVLPLRAGARITSYLPSAHAADRWSSHYNQMVFGIQITTVADPRQIAAALPDVRPTIWGGVPRIFEKLVAALEAGIAGEPDDRLREALKTAIDAGLQMVRLVDAGEPVPEELAKAHAQLDAHVLSKLRERIGLDEAEWIICGAAPLARHVHEFLLALGLPVVELYGMSECSCVLTVCHPSESRIGTVGTVIPGVELMRAEDGELLVRGPIVMRGYRDDPERTAEAFDAGKNMSPANIEEKLKSASPLIGQAVCIGDGRPYNVALLVRDPDAAPAYTEDGLQQEVADAVQRANDQLSRVEQIKRYRLLTDEWLAGGDELTPTMKLKRKPIAKKYADVIEELYA